MKVMHILDSLNRGGAEMLALDVCRNARAHGIDLTLVATGGGDLEEDFRNSGARFARLQRRLPFDPALALSLRRVMREREVAIVHAHQAVEALHARVAAAGTGVKHVLSFHLCSADAKNRAALKLLAPRSHANVAVSRGLLRCLREEAGFDTAKNFHVVYNGVDADRLRGGGASGDTDLRAGLGLTREHLLFGTVGNFYADERKDQLSVCRALPRLFVEEPRAHFVFVGAPLAADSDLHARCVAFCREHAIADHVHFAGQRADVGAVLRALDVFVLASKQEGLGIAAVEAMLAGVPALVSDVAPLLEVSGGGRYAAVARAGDAWDIARVMLDLAHDEARRARLKAEAGARAAAQFSIGAHVERLRALYEAVLSGGTVRLDETSVADGGVADEG